MDNSTQANSVSWEVGGKWILANFIGSISGAVFMFFIAYVMSGGFGSPSYMDPNAEPVKIDLLRMLSPLFFMGAIFGFLLAMCQALAIAAHLRSLTAWVFLTAIGFGIGQMSEYVLENIHFSWLLTCTLVGIFQWFILITQVQKSWLWIIANVAVGAGIEILGGWSGGVIAYLSLAFGSIVTGITLAWLIVHPVKLEKKTADNQEQE